VTDKLGILGLLREAKRYFRPCSYQN